ncbi:hypothetical protein [Alicyclobacillus acidoterrestris]|uniref:Uncharacterized protein n=1 Tax=Alicyclobacillus acidoterrestris (strain ATCC 49025 / DSM 3922 / CIP 106132 / NCIMB 13137 / GD3B) TaxID=1356854 RepID=T0BJA2_ALIAG|nr:hypothetical protein [Alicyclobacillus acidoterrestris]EPZ40824.1 hypothetical protein N007_17810 [Alicyclobacillus acidoterrestris ATCC 49025]UNO51015.1 hypothetical protein K1I37_21340 [Alicyclobacillus acidoterrestris]
MQIQLYLWSGLREQKKNQIKLYSDTFDKALALFNNIDEEAQRYGHEIFQQYGYGNPDADPADGADLAREVSLDYYLNMCLMRYNSIAMWITMLCQYWEQQLRDFLYQEISHDAFITKDDFCNDFGEVKDAFTEFGIHLESFTDWRTIKELRFICNALKHGEGGSLKRLYKLNPLLFCDGYDPSFSTPYSLTTLHEQRLKLDESLFHRYAETLIGFWDWMPERSYLKD